MTSYAIELLGFPSVPEEEAVRGLARAFGIDTERAQELVRSAPCAVKSDCSPEDTQRFIKALLHIGADVSVSNGQRSKIYRTEVRHRERKGPAQVARAPYSLGPDDDDGRFHDPRPFDPQALLTAPRARRPQGLGSALAAGASLALPSANAAATVAASAAPLPSRVPGAALRRDGAGGTKVPAAGRVWQHLGEALVYPVRGGGSRWLVAIALISAILVVFAGLQGFLFGITKILVMGLILVILAGLYSLQARFLALCLWGGATGDREGAAPPGDLDDFKGTYAFPGFVLLIASVGLYLPLILVAATRTKSPTIEGTLDFLASPLGVALFLFPFLYWPLGLALVATKGTVAEIANAPGIARGAWRGGVEYGLVALIGLVGPYVASALPQVVRDPRTLFALQPLLGTFVFGYIAGVQGYLMGVLYRRKPELLAG